MSQELAESLSGSRYVCIFSALYAIINPIKAFAAIPLAKKIMSSVYYQEDRYALV